MEFLQAFQGVIGLIVGVLLLQFLPYLVRGFKAVIEENAWAAWPKYETKYLASFGLTLLGIVAYFAMSRDALNLLGLEYYVAVPAGMGLKQLVREVLRPFEEEPGT